MVRNVIDAKEFAKSHYWDEKDIRELSDTDKVIRHKGNNYLVVIDSCDNFASDEFCDNEYELIYRVYPINKNGQVNKEIGKKYISSKPRLLGGFDVLGWVFWRQGEFEGIGVVFPKQTLGNRNLKKFVPHHKAVFDLYLGPITRRMYIARETAKRYER